MLRCWAHHGHLFPRVFLGVEEQTYSESQKPDLEWRQGSSLQRREDRTGETCWHHSCNRRPLTLHLGWQLTVSIAAPAVPAAPSLKISYLLVLQPLLLVRRAAGTMPRDDPQGCPSAAQMKLQFL